MTLKRILMCGCLLALLAAAAASPLPARAQTVWQPGTYSGWVYVVARLDKDHTINQQDVTLQQATVVYWQAHGDLEIRAEAGDQGWIDAYLPFEITGQENGSFSTPNGSCTFNILGLGQTVKQDLAALTQTAIGSQFKAGLIAPAISARVGRSSATGQCGSIQQTGLFINDTIKNTSEFLNGITFNVEYSSPLSVGGKCQLTDWDINMPIQYGSISRQTLECTWRVFRVP